MRNPDLVVPAWVRRNMRIIANNYNDSWDNFEFLYALIQSCPYAIEEWLSSMYGQNIRNNEHFKEVNSYINYCKKDKEWCRKKFKM